MWDEGYIYIVECDDNYKIGISVLPEQRVSLIKTDNAKPVSLVYLKEVPFAEDGERRIHKDLRERGLHVRGEWFKLDGETLDEVIHFIENYADTVRNMIEELDTSPPLL